MRKQRELLWDVVLALFVLAAAAALVRYLGVHDDPVREVFEAEDAAAEERAVQAVQRLHGKIVRAGPEPGKPVVAVDLSNTGVTDAGLKELAGLKQLRTLSLRGTQVTNTGLKELAGLQQLQELDLTDSQVTGAGLKDLVGMKQLRILSLGLLQRGFNKEDSHAAMDALAQLQQLEALHLKTTGPLGRESMQSIALSRDRLQEALPHCTITFGP
jgi:hypothetical protein